MRHAVWFVSVAAQTKVAAAPPLLRVPTHVVHCDEVVLVRIVRKQRETGLAVHGLVDPPTRNPNLHQVPTNYKPDHWRIVHDENTVWPAEGGDDLVRGGRGDHRSFGSLCERKNGDKASSRTVR